MNNKTSTCPNCGAAATNHSNCEFCGSLLVRFVEQNISVSPDYASNVKVAPGLIDALDENIRLQKEKPGIPVVTDINRKVDAKEAYHKGINTTIVSVFSDIYTSDGKPFFPEADFSNGKCHLMIGLSFEVQPDFAAILNKLLGTKEHEKFIQLDCLDLFERYQVKGEGDKRYFTYYQYAIDFGEDVEGAARIISKVLREVYDVNKFTELAFFTASNENIDELEKQRDKVSGKDKQNSYVKLIYWIAGIIGFIIWLLYQLG
jgi:hypothetical protein